MNLLPGLNENYLEIDKHRLHYFLNYNSPSEDVIIFLHGLPCALKTYSYALNKNYFPDKSQLFLDFPGFGKSSKIESFPYTMEAQAGMLDKLIASLPFENIHIAAHSMAGAIILLCNSETLLRVKSFANIEGNLVAEDCGILSRSILNVSADVYKSDVYPGQVEMFKGHPQLSFEETAPSIIYKSAVSLVQWSDSGELLKKFINLDKPKCYIYGEENKEMPLIKKLAGIKTYMISKGGHGMMYDNPEEFYGKLKEFISSAE